MKVECLTAALEQSLDFFKTNCCCTIARKITRSRSIQLELGKVEGFRDSLEARCRNLK